MPRKPHAYLFEILQAASRVQRFIGTKTFSDYAADELLRSAVERQCEIIGEALNQLRSQDEPLVQSIREHRKIIGFRNLLIHGYAEVDDTVVWSIISEKLPLLQQDAQRALSGLTAG